MTFIWKLFKAFVYSQELIPVSAEVMRNAPSWPVHTLYPPVWSRRPPTGCVASPQTPRWVTERENQSPPFCSHRNSQCKDPADTSVGGRHTWLKLWKKKLMRACSTKSSGAYFTWNGFRKTSGIPSIKMISHRKRANNMEKVEPSPWIPVIKNNNSAALEYSTLSVKRLDTPSHLVVFLHCRFKLNTWSYVVNTKTLIKICHLT